MAGGKGMVVAIGRVAVELNDRIAALRPDGVSGEPREDSTGVIHADNLGDAEVEAFTRFRQAHPKLPIFGKHAGLWKRVEVSDA